MLQTGVIFGDTYRLEKLLGRGGMGEVWLARHLLLQEPRAIKIMIDSSQADPRARERFIQGEARQALRLQPHPHIVRVYELGQQAGQPYMVMEYVAGGPEGSNLKELLKARGQLDPEQAGQILEQLAAAIDAAHAQHLLHRDIKPANILFDEQGQVKLSDFGLVKALHEEEPLTGSGYAIGTASYMAPEQALGQAEKASDVYALGVVLYEMLTGRLPFLGPLPSQLVQHATAQPISPQTLQPQIPAETGQVVLRALAKNPDDRYKSAGELAQAYRQSLVGSLLQGVSRLPFKFEVGVLSAPETQVLRQPVTTTSLPRPSGNITFLFIDIEGSTRLWERAPQAMQTALARHDELLREIITAHGGYVFKTIGDAFCASFGQAGEAVLAALEGQAALLAEPWSTDLGPLKVRMALHTGICEERDGDYFGPPLNRVARLLSVGYGGQILVSAATQELVRDQLPPETSLRDLGEHRLKDLIRPERIYQLVAPGLPDEFEPLKTLNSRPHNLPNQPTPLIGREQEITRTRQILRQPQVRLLTLTGAGGTGKTRLGLQLAADLLHDFENGVFFVPLAAVNDPAQVAPAIAQALGIKEQPGQDLTDNLKNYLHDKQMLLLLDNFEQVVGAASLVGDLLGAAPRLKLLITSRTVLHIYGEQEYQVPPLSLPNLQHLPAYETLATFPAIALFIQRARMVKPDFALTAENAEAIAGICARLDGLPLAIELAAARCKMLPPPAMLARLNNSLKLLTGGSRDLPARQQTLRGAIEWGYELLAEGEKQLLTRLAVFAGGSTLEAVEAVCNPAGDLPLDVLDGLASLVDKSMLRQLDELDEGGQVKPLDEPRFVMLQTIREYALEKLAAGGERDQLLTTHAAYYLAIAETAEKELTGPQQGHWLGRLELEQDNLRGALGCAIESNEGETALRLCGALWRYWQIRGALAEGRHWLEQSLAKGQTTPPEIQAKAYNAAGILARSQGDYDQAFNYIQQSLQLHRQTNQRKGVADALNTLGSITAYQGDYGQAATFHEESLAIRRELGDKRGIAVSLSSLGTTNYMLGQYSQAEPLLQEALGLLRQLGDVRTTAILLNNLGEIARMRGDYPKARACYEEGLAIRRELGDRSGTSYLLTSLGDVAYNEGHYDEACELYLESLTALQEIGDNRHIAICLEGLAGIAGARHQPKLAARLLGAAESLRETFKIVREPADLPGYERMVRTIREQLPEASFAAGWGQGRGMSLEEAVKYGLAINEIHESSDGLLTGPATSFHHSHLQMYDVIK